jgi:hypothetical protein
MFKKAEKEIVFVPIVGTDSRPYEERWADEAYLRTIEGFGGNGYFIGEVAEGLRRLRELADKAETPEELRGYNAGIASLKRLLTLPERAKRVRLQIAEIEERRRGVEFG